MQHRRDVVIAKKQTFLVKHFNEDDHGWKDMRITILDQCIENEGKPELRDREIDWIKIATSAYPYGFNDAIKGYGNISEWTENKKMTGSNCPYFKVPARKVRRNKKRGKKRRRSKIVDENFTAEIERLYTAREYKTLYQSLRHASKRTLKKAWHETCSVTDNQVIRLLICGYSIGYFDDKESVIKTMRKAGIGVRISYTTTKLDDINIQSFMRKTRNKRTLGYGETEEHNFKIPSLIREYGMNIGRILFNYKKFLTNLTEDEWNNTNKLPCECKGQYHHFTALNGHVITGDISIITDNLELRKVMKKGTNYRPNDDYMTRRQLDEFQEEVMKYAKKAYCKQDHENKTADVNRYTQNVIRYIEHNIRIEEQEARTHRKWKSKVLDDLICTPVDKAGNNFAFICKKMYVEMIKKEMNTVGPTAEKTYSSVNITQADLVRKHDRINRVFDLTMDTVNEEIPVLFGIPKFHKNPVKMRYIAGASKSTMKPLAITAHNMLRMMKSHFIQYCKVIETRTREKRYISIQSSNQVVTKIEAHARKFDRIATYDFSTLYTKLPHNQVLSSMFFLIDLLFKNCGKNFVVINTQRSKFGAPAFYSNDQRAYRNRIVLDKTGAKEIIYTLINEAYVKVGNKIFKQISGIPMGSNVSPLIADLVLSVMEFKFMEMPNVQIPAKAVLCRYLDDILAINIDIANMIDNAYATELEINEETGINQKVSYLDMQFDLDENIITPYNKTKVFKFEVIRAYHETSCVPKRMINGVVTGTMHRYCNTASKLADLIDEIVEYGKSLVERGHDRARILDGIIVFIGRNKEQLYKYKLLDKKEIKNKVLFPIMKRLK